MTLPKGGSPIAINSPALAHHKRVLVIFGTRPEAIKLSPLIAKLKEQAESAELRPVVCVTAQHREMLDQVLAAFQIKPDYDLDLMRPNQTLPELGARLLSGLADIFADVKPAMAVVQGDTATTLYGALAAFYARVPLAHVEAGLRTFDMQAPFPEEMNRVLTSRLAALHFAATEWAAENLVREGVPPTSIEVTGNTGIDAVLSVRALLEKGILHGTPLPIDDGKRLIVVTAHRRESFGEGFKRICSAIAQIAGRDDIQIVWPVHPNPNVQSTVRATFQGQRNVLLIEPLSYVPFVDLMRRAFLLITDSGGVQEEGPSLGKPILVLREKTERPEAVKAGTVKLVGTDSELIAAETARLLDDPGEYNRMARLHNPYGDGRASERIARRLAAYLH